MECSVTLDVDAVVPDIKKQELLDAIDPLILHRDVEWCFTRRLFSLIDWPLSTWSNEKYKLFQIKDIEIL